MTKLISSSLTNSQLKFLRSLAHSLSPIVATGGKGLTEAVIEEIKIAISSHELVKVKLGTNDRDERAEYTKIICEEALATPVQQIGKVLVIYKRNKEKTQIILPR